MNANGPPLGEGPGQTCETRNLVREESSGRQRPRKTDRRATRAAPSVLVDPILIAEWKRNRAGETIRVRLSNFEDFDLIDIRTWHAKVGYRVPGKGFSCGLKHLPTLVKALGEALAKARELGLLPDGGAS